MLSNTDIVQSQALWKLQNLTKIVFRQLYISAVFSYEELGSQD